MSELKFSHPDDWRLAEHLATLDPKRIERIWHPHTTEEIRQHLRDSRKHQGYANFETFSVGLVIDNNRALLEAARTIVRDAITADPDVDLWPARAADALKSWVERNAEPVITGPTTATREFRGLASTLAAAALAEVDWLELAEEYAKGEGE